METKRNLAERAAMTLLLAVLTVTSAWATMFYTDVMLVGGTRTGATNLATNLLNEGWVRINKNLNTNFNTQNYVIFLLYKRADSETLNEGDYITDFYITDSENYAPSYVINGKTYKLVEYRGTTQFNQTGGDLNYGTNGTPIHLYYTKDEFADHRAVTDITFTDDPDGAVGVNGGTEGYDLNHGVANVTSIYMHVTWGTALPKLQGAGTSSDPFIISNAYEWDSFADKIERGLDTDCYYELTENIPTADDIATGKTAVTSIVGTDEYPFRGNFFGNGKSVNVSISNSEEAPAPFGHVYGATIEELTVNGSVACTDNNFYGGGLIGRCTGGITVINECTVTAQVSGNCYVGGIVGHAGNEQLIIRNGVFSGILSGFQNYSGGLVGWCDSADIILSNCLFKGSFNPGAGGLFHPVICKDNFSSPTVTVHSVYYLKNIDTTAVGDNVVQRAEGTPVSTIPFDGEYEMPVRAADGNIYYAVPNGKEIITQAPAGVVKVYERSGYGYYLDGNTSTSRSQEGMIEIIYTDNNEVYLKNLLCFARSGTYVKGVLQNNKIVVPLPQTLITNTTGNSLELAWVSINENEPQQYADRKAGTATFTVNGNTVSLDDSNSRRVLGVVWDYDDYYYGAGDYKSVYTESFTEEHIAPPAGLTPVTYHYSGSSYYSGASHHFSSDVKVVKDGNDVYIQGLANGDSDYSILPNAWAKGTLDGDELIIPTGQYMGLINTYPIYLLGAASSIQDITFIYNPEKEAFTLEELLLVNSLKDQISVYTYTKIGAVIGINDSDVLNFDLVTLPQGVVAENDWTLEGEYVPGNSISVNKSIEVAFNGNDVYVKGICYEYPDAWMKGTIHGMLATFPTGQFMGEDSYYHYYMISYGETDTEDILFQFDKINRRFALVSPYLICNTTLFEIYIKGYYESLLFYDNNVSVPSVVNVPAGLKTETYTWTGKKVTTYSDTGGGADYTDFSRLIQIGFDGNNVYVKGLCEEIPDSWAKGTVNGNTARFTTGQYLGTDDTYMLWGQTYPHLLIGFNENNHAVCDVVFNYDAAKKTFTTDTWLVNNCEAEELNSDSYYNIYSNNVWYCSDKNGVPTGITENNGKGVKNVRYYNAAGISCDQPTTSGLYIVVKEMEDGTVKTEKRKY